MSILHYTIGLPPKRHGGSVQYAADLMTEQVAQGHKVFALICGDTLLRMGKTSFKPNGDYNGIPVYALTNPLTPTLVHGVADPDAQHHKQKLAKSAIEDFIRRNKIEILHLHTLQGMHKDVLELIKSQGVKIINTSHDFHGICPHYNLIDWEGKLCNEASPERCARCNANAPSELFLRVGSSALFQAVKSNKIGKLLQKRGVKRTSTTVSQSADSHLTYNPNAERINQFQRLLQYYREYFKLVDSFHFNSQQTRKVFEHFLGPLSGKVIPVVTASIKDKRKSLEIHDTLTFGYIGKLADYKGFPMLKEVMTDLYNEGIHNIRIKAYCSSHVGHDEECPLIEYMPPYKYSEMSDILYHLDGTIVPSKWYETFSLVTLESLSHGRPVICSGHVGAKDIVANYSPDFIFSNKEELKNLLRRIAFNPDTLAQFQESIMNKEWLYNMHNHGKDILNFYKSHERVNIDSKASV